MPVEIMELVIKAKVTDQQSQQQGAPLAPATSNSQNDAQVKAVEKAVQEVLEIIKRKNER